MKLRVPFSNRNSRIEETSTSPSAKNISANLRRQGSVLIIVLWVAFGLVSLTLYFANSMSFESRAADNRVASMEAEQAFEAAEGEGITLCDTLADEHETPYECFAHEEVRAKVEAELKEVPEPYRTTLILRDLEEMSYEEIAELLEISLGTVKSRLTRGRDALRQRLAPYVREVGNELGLTAPGSANEKEEVKNGRSQVAGGGRRAEVMR